MGALGFGLTGFGFVLVWAGVKGEDLRAVLTDVFTGRRRFVGSSTKTAPPKPGGNNAGVPVALTAASRIADAGAAGYIAGATTATAPPGTVAE